MMKTKAEINVALVGVGNCASSLVQAIAADRRADRRGAPGVINEAIGRYRIADMRVVCAFDVDCSKVGSDVAEAISAPPNCTTNYVTVPPLGVRVLPGPVLDGLDGPHGALITADERCLQLDSDYVAERFKAAGVDVVICYLPTGSRNAVRCYADATIKAGAAFVNATPELIANDPEYRSRFADAGLVVLGDDVRSQLGATALHMALVELCRSRAASVDETYQLNIGGNTDFLNMSDKARAASKCVSKRKALTGSGINGESISAGPSGYVSQLADNKVAYIHLAGELLLGMRFKMEVRLQVEDSPNSAGVIVDAIRIARVASDLGHRGVVNEVCPFLFKSPPVPTTETRAREDFSTFLKHVAATDDASGVSSSQLSVG